MPLIRTIPLVLLAAVSPGVSYGGQLMGVFSGVIHAVDDSPLTEGFTPGDTLSGYYQFDPLSAATQKGFNTGRSEYAFYDDAVTGASVEFSNGIVLKADSGSIRVINGLSTDWYEFTLAASDLVGNPPDRFSTFTCVLSGGDGSLFATTEIPSSLPDQTLFNGIRLEFLRFGSGSDAKFVRFQLTNLQIVPEPTAVALLPPCILIGAMGCRLTSREARQIQTNGRMVAE